MRTTVLIVDDHGGFRARARRLLEAEGYAVVGEAEDGAGGVAAARRIAPDLVLLDLQLPDATGFAVAAELCARARRSGGRHHVDARGAEYGKLARDNGARGFVPKAELSGAALDALLE